MKASKILFNISAVICMIFGALYIFSLVFIPIGIYCFIAAKRFVYKADHIMDTFAISNKTLKNYVIFASIACFPLGLVSIIPYLLVVGNNVSVSEVEQYKNDNNVTISDADTYSEDVENSENNEIESVEAHIELTEAEKQEKFEKLKNFHEKGIITDDELEMARQQLFGNSENK